MSGALANFILAPCTMAHTPFRSCFWALLLSIASISGCQRAPYFFPAAGAVSVAIVAPDCGAADAEVLPLVLGSPERLPQVPRTSHRGLAGQRRTLAVVVRHQRLAARMKLRAQRAPICSGKSAAASTAATVPPLKQRSRVVAIILAVLSIVYLPLSLHNFYLGYYGRGLAAISLFALGIFLLILGAVGSFGTSSALIALGYFGLVILAGWFVWQLADLLRIITGTLQPKNGVYRYKSLQP